MKQIIHLSDLHIGYSYCERRFDMVLYNLMHTKKPENYVIVITGDLVDVANETNYKNAKSKITILENEGYQVLIVPGNHDYGDGVINHEKFIQEFKKVFFNDPVAKYPKIDFVNQGEADSIAFIGLDSMGGDFDWRDPHVFAQGKLGDDQINDLDKILKNDNDVISAKHKVVYLHHHPFDDDNLMLLKDSGKLGEVLQRYTIDALLFGHKHQGIKWSDNWKIKRVYDAGTSTSKLGDPYPHRVIDLTQDRRFDYDAEFWNPGVC